MCKKVRKQVCCLLSVFVTLFFDAFLYVVVRCWLLRFSVDSFSVVLFDLFYVLLLVGVGCCAS